LIIVDASVLVAALGDDGSDGKGARGRLRGEDLAVPNIVDLEVASVLRGRVRGGHLSVPRARQALDDLADLPMERVGHATLLPRVWELRDNYTPYDAAYIALAELFRAPLVTGDARMARGSGARCVFELVDVSS
jgi:predicted nucleic acid-binding protein